MDVHTFRHPTSGTFSYVVIHDGEGLIIDPVIDLVDGVLQTHASDELVHTLRENDATLKYVFETHIHADHLSGTNYVKTQYGGETGIGAGVEKIYSHWQPHLNGAKLAQFDHWLTPESELLLGGLELTVISTPGHTPACISYLIGGHVFVGDTLFEPKRGTARADFPGGSAADLFESIRHLYHLPDETRVHLCHDYPERDDEAISCTLLNTQKTSNIMLNERTSKSDYIQAREGRDQGLKAPKLLMQAIPFNLTYQLNHNT